MHMPQLCAPIKNDYFSNENLVRRVILKKNTLHDSLGLSLIVFKHCQSHIYAVFIDKIQSNSLAHLSGQLYVGDQILCINDIYLDSADPTRTNRTHQLLADSRRLSIELVLIRRIPNLDHSYAAVSSSKNNGHSCIPILSTPFHVGMVLNTLWTQIEVVELTNDGSGLGFGISGNKSTGVVVKAIVPGSIADKDGRIHTGDHLFQINHVYVRGMSSDQVAGILRQCSEQVRLVVARSIREPTGATSSSPTASQRPSIQSENFTQSRNPSSTMAIDNDGIINNSQKKIHLRTERLLENNHNLEKILDNLLEQCQYEDGTELLDVTLEKGDDGLGITVAGYVSADSTNNDAVAGIFIRDIADGSVSARDGRLAIGDQIIEVNDQSLNGFSNVQALYLLQNTSSSVRLKVRRYLDGAKHDKIKEMIAMESSQQIEEKLEFQDQSNINEQIRQKWLKSLGNNFEILIIDVYKSDHGSLGITLEGTIDLENGEAIGAHHYIRTLSSEGIIETEGTLKPGDELLEINNQVLYGKNHIQVIEILKRVKHQIKLISARRKSRPTDEINRKSSDNRPRSISFKKTTEVVVKAKSMGTLDYTNNPSLRPMKVRSLEVISNLALWSTSIMNIELNKGDHGLGFSVLDYQDPSNPSYLPVIVIRALVPGGVAQLDGRLVPGDRLVAVNDIILENKTLDDVIIILKSTLKGPVKLSISKPLPYPKFKNDSDEKIITDSDQNGNHKRRLSRLSKSKTTTEITNNHKRSVSTNRSVDRKAAVSPGIALSAPAILSRHEYMETLLMKENLIKQPEQRPLSTHRKEKTSRRTHSSKRSKFLPEKSHQNTSKEHLDFFFRNPPNNLPEFIHFQSDHLIPVRKPISHPPSDRVRSSSTHQTFKSNRSQAASNKRLTTSRHSCESIVYPESREQNSLLQPVQKKFDSISCFNEPELSSDDNDHFTRSSSLTNEPIQSNKTRSATDLDQIDAMQQVEEPFDQDLEAIVQTRKSSPSPSKQSPQLISPAPSTGSLSSGRMMTLLNHPVIQLPVYLEREIVIKQHFDQLDLIVDASVDDGINGCCIRSIASASIDHCLQAGDFLVSINHENMRQISNTQASTIIQHAAFNQSDIRIIFILAEEAKQFKEQVLDPQMIPARSFESDIDLFQPKFHDENDVSNVIDTETLCLTLWGPPRTVILHRDELVKSLGISIVGGKLDFSGPGNTIETCISGIFIKHVIPDSLAGRHSNLKTGDRILEVNGNNLRDATHDHAVEIIRSAHSPIYFLVQSLLDPSNPNAYEKQYEHLDGELLSIQIKRKPAQINEPLGLSLIGHRDPEKLAVFICDIQSNSLLGRHHRIRIGDQLLQVNDEILLGKAHSTVTSIIKANKSETLNFIILRNSNAIDDMALNNPYASNSHHDLTHVNECRKVDDRLRSTSVSSLIQNRLDDHVELSNQIKTPNVVGNSITNNDVRSDQNKSLPISSDVTSPLFNQSKNDLSPRLSEISGNKQTTEYNGPFVSHIPIMSSSSSSSSVPHPSNERMNIKSDLENLNTNDLRTRAIVTGEETLIEIDREESGLGLSVVGGANTQLSAIIIHDIYEGCAARRDGRLIVGDQIREVNSIDLRSATHEEAIKALRQSTNIVRLVVLRREIINEEDKFDVITVDFIKRAGKGLGFSIIGRRQGCGVFISHIIEGSSAEKDGRLMPGDLILEVNGQDLRTAAYVHAAYTLKTLPHARVYIKIGRLKVNASETEPIIRSRSPSTTNKINDR